MSEAGLAPAVYQVGEGDVLNGQGQHVVPQEIPEQNDEEEDSVAITINNVVCSFNTRCHLNLKRIAMEGSNVEYRRQHGMLNMRIRRPYTTASVWSSGKITCTGATSEDDSKIAARKFARQLQKLGYKVRFTNFRVVNVLGTCSLPFAINITEFSRKHKNASYEPELHPGVTYKLHDPKATLKIFSTGSITVTAPRVMNIDAAIHHIYPLVKEYSQGKAEKSKHPSVLMKKRRAQRQRPVMFAADDEEEDEDSEMYDSEMDSEEFDSEESLD